MSTKYSPDGMIAEFVTEATGWDMVSGFDIQLYHATLKIDIGRFKAGTTVDTIVFMFMETSETVIQIYVDKVCYEYPVKFSVSFGEERLPIVNDE